MIRRTSIALALIASIVLISLLFYFENNLRGDQPYQRFDMMRYAGPDILPIPEDQVWAGRHIPGQPYFGEEHLPGRPFHADGVAQSSEEFLPFCIRLIDMRQLPPYHARALLKENRSLDEIKREIWEGEGKTVLRGNLIAGRSRYLLTNISQTFEGNYTVLLAELLDFREFMKGDSDQIAGRISIKTIEDSGFLFGEGDLVLYEDHQIQSYRLTLLTPMLDEPALPPLPGESALPPLVGESAFL